jgi:hypothetical protein
MPSASALRSQIEIALADRIPSALTPVAKTIREGMPTGIAAIDALLDGGLPVGAVTEMVGAECSGRTAFALSFVAQVTKAESVCAWIDVSNSLSPESAAAAGIDLKRLLWVRCGVQPTATNSRSTSHDSIRPAGEVSCAARRQERAAWRRLRSASPHRGGGDFPGGISGLLGGNVAPRCAEPQRRISALSGRRLSRLQSASLQAQRLLDPDDETCGRGSSRDCEPPTCCCRRAASAVSCWTRAALRRSTSRAFRWRHGSATGQGGRGAEPGKRRSADPIRLLEERRRPRPASASRTAACRRGYCAYQP